MDREKLQVELAKTWDGDKAFFDNISILADYILDNFVSKEEVQNREADLQDLLNDYWEKKLQDSKPRECGQEIRDDKYEHAIYCETNGSKYCSCSEQYKNEHRPTPPSICQHEWVGIAQPTWTCSFCGLTNYVGEDCKCNKKHATTNQVRIEEVK